MAEFNPNGLMKQSTGEQSNLRKELMSIVKQGNTSSVPRKPMASEVAERKQITSEDLLPSTRERILKCRFDKGHGDAKIAAAEGLPVAVIRQVLDEEHFITRRQLDTVRVLIGHAAPRWIKWKCREVRRQVLRDLQYLDLNQKTA